MVDPDIVARRLLALSEALRELDRPAAADARALGSDPVLRAAVERWLQVAVEACIDVAYHLASDEGWPPPESGRAAFTTLAAHGRIDHELAQRLGRAAAMRNVLVHDYVSVDLTRLAAAVRDDLGDLRTFASIAATWIGDSDANG